MSNFANEYVINVGGEIVRLKKGMSKLEVISILGDPQNIETCKNESNEKLTYKISSLRLAIAFYTLLFIREELAYVAKLN